MTSLNKKTKKVNMRKIQESSDEEKISKKQKITQESQKLID